MSALVGPGGNGFGNWSGMMPVLNGTLCHQFLQVASKWRLRGSGQFEFLDFQEEGDVSGAQGGSCLPNLLQGTSPGDFQCAGTGPSIEVTRERQSLKIEPHALDPALPVEPQAPLGNLGSKFQWRRQRGRRRQESMVARELQPDVARLPERRFSHGRGAMPLPSLRIAHARVTEAEPQMCREAPDLDVREMKLPSFRRLAGLPIPELRLQAGSGPPP